MSDIIGRDLSYIYNPKEESSCVALNDVTFTFKQGEFVCLVGKTGSGKSTLVQTLNALILPSDGYIENGDFIITGNKKLKKELLNNKNKEIRKINKKYSSLRKEVGLVFQFPEYQLFAMNILKDVMFGPMNFGLNEKDAELISKNTLIDVGLNETYFGKSPFEISGGEKRRVALAGIMASNPKILVLDEPTAGLDSRGKETIMKLIREYHSKGNTIIVVTHDMDLVLENANKVFVLNNGKIVKEATPLELFSKTNLEDYSLEQPLVFKFKNLLKEKGFAGNLEKIQDFDSLIDSIIEEKKHG